jgi:hypothetical protein
MLVLPGQQIREGFGNGAPILRDEVIVNRLRLRVRSSASSVPKMVRGARARIVCDGCCKYLQLGATASTERSPHNDWRSAARS